MDQKVTNDNLSRDDATSLVAAEVDGITHWRAKIIEEWLGGPQEEW